MVREGSQRIERQKIGIIDPVEFNRLGLAAELRGYATLDLHFAVATFAEAIASTGGAKPDIVLLGLTRSSQRGLGILRDVRACTPKGWVIVMTPPIDDVWPTTLTLSGADRVVSYTLTREQLGQEIRLAQESLAMRAHQASAAPCGVALTPRQGSVLDLVQQGLTNVEIGDSLGISEHTVEKHVSALLGKFAVAHRRDLQRLAKAAAAIL